MEPTTGSSSACACDRTRQWSIAGRPELDAGPHDTASRNKPARPLLVDYKTLGHRFRDAYIAGVRSLIQRGQLKMESPEAMDRLLTELALIDWAAFIQPPPRDECRPEHIVRYLARYMTGGPISDSD